MHNMNQVNLNKLPFIFNGKFFEVNFFDEGTGKISAYCQECSKIGKTKLIPQRDQDFLMRRWIC